MLAEIVRKVLLTYWNTASFLIRYANAGGQWTPEAAGLAPAPGERPLLDRWLLSEVHGCVRDVTASLEAFDTAAAGRRLAALIDDLSNWYVRRSRRRFWSGPGQRDGASAFATLHEALVAVIHADGADHAVPARLRLGLAAAAGRARVGAPGRVAHGRRRR